MSNVTLPATGSVVATDTVGAAEYQVVKQAYGAAGSATLVSPANPFPSQLRDGTGTLIDSLAGGGSGSNGILAAIGGTFFFVSTLNSSTTQLASSATFTGTVETIFNAQAFSILCTSDQNGTLTLIQYIDAGGTRIAKSTAYPILANIPFSYSEVANGNYFKATFQNTGGSTTTTFNLNIAYGTLPSVTNLGNSPAAINEINGTAISLGQKSAATSFPVTLSNENVQDLYFTGQATQTAAINNIIPSTASSAATDCTGYHSGYVQIYCPAGTFTTGAIIFEGANDSASGTIFQTIPVFNQLTGALSSGAITLVTTTSVGYTFPISFRYIRVRISTAVTGGGTVQAFSKFSQSSWQPPFYQVMQPTAANLNAVVSQSTAANLLMSAVQSGTWTAQIGNTANTTPILANKLIPVGTTTGDTGAKTATGNGATQTNVNGVGALIVFNVGTVSGTSPTCVFKIQGSADAGTTWVDIPAANTASLTATGVFGILINQGITVVAGTTTTGTTAAIAAVLPRTWRVVWTIGGTTPSFTITNVQVVYHL